MLEIAAAHVQQAASVRSPAELTDLLAVVFGVLGELPAAIFGRFGDPYVASAPRIQDPRDPAAWTSSKIVGERSRQRLFERKPRRGCLGGYQ